jgi:hypothetical protein
VPCLAHHESAIPTKTTGMQTDFNGFIYQTVNATCTPGKNGDLIKVNFLPEFYAVFCNSRYLWLVSLYVTFMHFAFGCYGAPCLSCIHFDACIQNAVNAQHIIPQTVFRQP